MTLQQQKLLTLAFAVTMALAILIIAVHVAGRPPSSRKLGSFEPMSVVSLQTSDDAGLQEMPTNLSSA